MIKILVLIMTFLAFAKASDININTIATKAEKTGKHILVFVHTPYCGYCKRMIKTTLNADPVAAKIKKDFIFVDIDVSEDGLISYNSFKGSKREFANILDLEYYPSTYFIKKDDTVYEQAGYQDEKYFLKILNYVSEKAYEDMGIEEFKEVK